ncbi:hypothetical protein TRVA0_092S00122 [Trichomonascus vanleenenianus]|uniref:uncharacterized protein n=1 Tax=Trichomonascus vanleenenianus TaxID=2268995 RepID=UPI003EC960C9
MDRYYTQPPLHSPRSDESYQAMQQQQQQQHHHHHHHHQQHQHQHQPHAMAGHAPQQPAPYQVAASQPIVMGPGPENTNDPSYHHQFSSQVPSQMANPHVLPIPQNAQQSQTTTFPQRPGTVPLAATARKTTIPKLPKKSLHEMDGDELLLASEEGKQLTSKERRQLRNRVSARQFRLRRKEYITHLETMVGNMTTELNALEQCLAALKEQSKTMESTLDKMHQTSQQSDRCASCAACANCSRGPSTADQLMKLQLEIRTKIEEQSQLIAQQQQTFFKSSRFGNHTPSSTFESETESTTTTTQLQHPASAPPTGQMPRPQPLDDAPVSASQPNLSPPEHMPPSDAVNHSPTWPPHAAGSANDHGASHQRPQSIRMNSHVVNLLPMYSWTAPQQQQSQSQPQQGPQQQSDANAEWGLDYGNTNQQQHSEEREEHGIIRVPNAQIFRSLVPEIEKPIDELFTLDEIELAKSSTDSSHPESEEEDQDRKKRLEFAVAMAEDVFKQLDAQLSNMRFPQ